MLTLDDETRLYLSVNTVIKGDDVYGAGMGTTSKEAHPAFDSFINRKVTRFEHYTDMSEAERDEYVPWLVDFEAEGNCQCQSVFFMLDDGTRIDGTLMNVLNSAAAGQQ
jgi:hypothetical protein